MAEISTQELFTDTGPDNVVTAARLNNMIATLQILEEFISSKSTATPVGGDALVFYDASAVALAKTTYAEVIAAFIGTSGTTLAVGNDTRFPASITGLRKGAGVGSADTAATSADLAFAPAVAVVVGGTATVIFSTNTRYTLTLLTNAIADMSGFPDGSTCILRTTQDATGGRTLSFTTTGFTKLWVGGTDGVVSPGANAVDTWEFQRWGTTLLIKQFAAWAT